MRPIDADAYKQKIKDAYEKLGKEEQTKPIRYLTIEDIVDIEMDCIDHVPTVDGAWCMNIGFMDEDTEREGE